MKNFFLFYFIIFCSCHTFGQNSYIQVTGEPNLSVYLNNELKGKTTTEFNGYIIEGVIAGKNIIKIVKEGYTPFEETITVKSGEVFAYKVKPFTKNPVYISERGNSGETEKQAVIQTGDLVVQSVPIDIKITIPSIDGVKNSPKAKDKWMAENIPTGLHEISFLYGQKKITKTVRIEKEKITTVFINMMNSEFTEKSKDMPPYKNRDEAISYINKILTEQSITFKTWHCKSCSDKRVRELVKNNMITYNSNALKYSESNSTYKLTYNYFMEGLRGVPKVYDESDFSHTYDLSDISLKGEMTYNETSCADDYASGKCRLFWIKFPDKKNLAFYLSKDEIFSQLKNAFLYLQELE